MPPAAAIDPATGVFTWTPGYFDAGVYTAEITVTDELLEGLAAKLQSLDLDGGEQAVLGSILLDGEVMGGVAPVPLVAAKTAAFLVGKAVNAETLHAAADVLDQEIAPIDDVRGSARYKRLAARRILFAHALKAAPDLLQVEAFV